MIQPRKSLLTLFSAVLVILAGCSDDDGGGTGPAVPSEPATVSLDVEADTLTVGDTLRLTATVTDSAGATLPDAEVRWVTTEEAVASVSESGTVRGKAAGTAVVVAQSGAAADSATIQVLDPESELRCERLGYPCNVSEVPLEIRERSEELGIAASESLTEGASIGEVAAELEGAEGVVEVLTSLSTVVFRLEGGGPFWVFGGAEARADATPAPSTLRVDPGLGPTGASQVSRSFQVSRFVVGAVPETKRALILSPYRHEFGRLDEGAAVAEILNDTRGYRGAVTYLEDDAAGPEAWSDWHEYDLIHVATHGAVICPSDAVSECVTGLSTAIPMSEWEEIDDAAPGVWPGTSSGDVTATLTDEFFYDRYPDGLDETFVWVNSSQTLLGSKDDDSEQNGLAQILTSGQNTVYFGWSEGVPLDAAHTAALTFYEFMTEHGVVTASGLAELARRGHDHATVHNIETGESVRTRLERVTDLTEPSDLRLREIISILDPIDGTEIEDGDAYPVSQSVGESVQQALRFSLEVDGVEDGDAAGYTVHISVDGEALSGDGWSLSDGEENGDYTWTLERTAGLGSEVTNGQEVEIRAVVELPDGGTSEVTRTVRLVVSQPDLELHVDSRIRGVLEGGPGSGDAIILHMASVIELEYDDESQAYTGSGVLEHVEVSVGACTQGSLVDGELKVASLTLPGATSSGDGLILTYGFSKRPTHSVRCEFGPVSEVLDLEDQFMNVYLWAHSEYGELVEDSSEELIGGVLQLSEWDFGTEDPVIARRVYEETLPTGGGTAVTEETTIELRSVP